MLEKYPNCSQSSVDVGYLGDGKCHKKFNSDECGYDDGDCSQFNIDFPNCTEPHNPYKLYNGECDYTNPQLNTKQCGWDNGDCVERNEKMREKYPICPAEINLLGDGHCFLPYNTAECGWDDGECEDVKSIEGCNSNSSWAFGDGKCRQQHNNPECKWDDGDCEERNNALKNMYPNCPSQIVDTKYIATMNDNKCNYAANIESCGWDGGDCLDSNEAFKAEYPECNLIRFNSEIGNKKCSLRLNTAECG